MKKSKWLYWVGLFLTLLMLTARGDDTTISYLMPPGDEPSAIDADAEGVSASHPNNLDPGADIPQTEMHLSVSGPEYFERATAKPVQEAADFEVLDSALELELRELDVDDGGQLVIPDGFHALGSYSTVSASARLAARELSPSALALPQDYVRACALTDYWKPVPPPGYVCLGLVEAAQKPLLEEVRCVRHDLTTTGLLGARLQPSGVSRHVIPTGLEGIQIGTFGNAWELLVPAGPWGNASGMQSQHYYYGTIQTADLDGDGQDELLGRAANGMQVYRVDSVNRTWDFLVNGGPFPDAGGFTQFQYYSTIQTADLDGNGRDELLGRAYNGMQVWRFDTVNRSWELLVNGGPFSNPDGWGQYKFYSTIQTADVDGDGQAELLARGSTGMQVWRFDSLNGSWEPLGSGGPFPSNDGWDEPQFNSTIQTADVDGDGQDELLGRASTGMQVWRFDSLNGSWELLDSGGPFPDADGWDQDKFYSTIQTADVGGDSQAELLARGSTGMQVWRFDSGTGSWASLSSVGPFRSDDGWDEPQFNSTIQTADVDGDGQKDLLGRGSTGVVAYSYKYNAETDSGSWQGESYGPPFNSPEFDAEDHYLTLQTADVDGDGASDVLVRSDAGMLAYGFVATNRSWSGRALPRPVLDASMVQLPEPLSATAVEGLIQDHGPVMYFHPEEQYFPDDPQWALDNGIALAWGLVQNESDYDTFSLTYEGAKATSAGTLMDDVHWLLTEVKPYPPYNDASSFRYWLDIPDPMQPGDLTRAKAVVRVVPWNYFSTEIQFWSFYPFNGPARIRTCLTSSLCDHEQLVELGRHYGDWEHVTLRFRNRTGELEAVYMSAHAGGQWFGLNDFGVGLQFEDSHPIVYSAKYSHAHYPTADRFYYKRAFEVDIGLGTVSADLYDDTSSGGSIGWGNPGRYGYISHESDPALPADWLAFAGRWGKHEKLAEWIYWGELQIYRYTEVGRGPTGPNMKTPWKIGSSAAALGIWLDSDNDGVADTQDNCILHANVDQRDTDQDGYGSLCDPDFDNSGIVNAADLAYLKVNFFSADALADLTGDGIVNAADLAILKTMFFKPPGPSCCGDVLP